MKRLLWCERVWKITTKRCSCGNPKGKIIPRIWLMHTRYGRKGPKIHPVNSKVWNENMFIFDLYKAMRAQEGIMIRVYLHSFFNLGARWGSLDTPRPGRFTPCKEIRCPLHRRLCETQDQSARVQKTSPHCDPIPDRPAHSSRYTDYATPVYVRRATLVEPTPSQNMPLTFLYYFFMSAKLSTTRRYS